MWLENWNKTEVDQGRTQAAAAVVFGLPDLASKNDQLKFSWKDSLSKSVSHKLLF